MQGQPPPLLVLEDRTLRVCVDSRNAKALFPSIPENMQKLLKQQLQEMAAQSKM
jgi:hypothetical protein